MLSRLVPVLSAAILPAISTAQTAAGTDDAAIRAAVRTFEDGWNAHNMDAMFQAFASDVEFVNIVGMHRGRTAGRKARTPDDAQHHLQDRAQPCRRCASAPVGRRCGTGPCALEEGGLHTA